MHNIMCVILILIPCNCFKKKRYSSPREPYRVPINLTETDNPKENFPQKLSSAKAMPSIRFYSTFSHILNGWSGSVVKESQ